jgi:hypothetical protein
MRTAKISPIVCLLLLMSAFGCAENKTPKGGSNSPTYSTTGSVNAPVDHGVTPTSDRPAAEPHIYSNSPNQAVSSPTASENP